MYTLSGNHYKRNAVFRKETFFVLPAGATTHIPRTQFEYEDTPQARVFHQCPELQKGMHSNEDVGIVFLQDDPKMMVCDRCHKSPHDDVITVWTLLKEA
jgi:hypothetical protein